MATVVADPPAKKRTRKVEPTKIVIQIQVLAEHGGTEDGRMWMDMPPPKEAFPAKAAAKVWIQNLSDDYANRKFRIVRSADADSVELKRTMVTKLLPMKAA